MKLTQRNVTLSMLSLLTATSVLLCITYLIIGDRVLVLLAGAGILIEGALLVLYWRGWDGARYAIVAIVTLMIALGLPEPYLTQQITLAICIAPVIALIVASPAWVVGSALVLYTVLLLRAGGQGIYASPQTLIVFALIVGGMILARLVADTALRAADENARQADEARAQAVQKAEELKEANHLMNIQLDQQQRLLDLVATLETPAVSLAEGVLFAPIVGHVDSRRAQQITARLLEAAHSHRTRLVILDIMGVPVMDTVVARALLGTAQALRLLGCQVTISGISSSVAMTLIHLGISLEGVATARTPQEALAQLVQSPAVSAN
jgi:anti-anti-sigma regulatory factor